MARIISKKNFKIVEVSSRKVSPFRLVWKEVADGEVKTRYRHFATRKEAEKEGRIVTSPVYEPPPTLLEKAEAQSFEAAIKRCKTAGVTIDEVLAAGFKGLDVVKACELPLHEVIAQFLWAMKTRVDDGTLRPATYNSYDFSLRQLEKILGDVPFGDISPRRVISAIEEFSPSLVSRRNYLSSTRPLFSWASEREPDPWFDVNALKLLRLSSEDRKMIQKQQKARLIELFDADQVRTVFGAVDKKYHAALAIAFFAGVRPGTELAQLQWEFNDRGHRFGVLFDSRIIRMHASWCKNGEVRVIQNLPDNIWAILERAENKTGSVMGCARKAWKANVLDPAKKALGIKAWPRDVTRHSFASNYFQVGGLTAVVDALGHADTRMLIKHYKATRTKAEAKDYFSIGLESEPQKIIPLGKAKAR